MESQDFWEGYRDRYKIKYLIYDAILRNLLVCRCESLAVAKGPLRKLEFFHMRSIRGILDICWNHVMEDKFSNKKVRKNLIILKT